MFSLKLIEDSLLFVSFLFLVFGGIVLSFKTNFIQIRSIPKVFKIFFRSLFCKEISDKHIIKPHRALFTAMSTSLGIGNIIAPVIAISFGGPGALLGFLLATIFGSATIFVEVAMAIKYRKKSEEGAIFGGPMQYLKNKIHPFLAFIYALSACIMLLSWSGRQINTLSKLLSFYNAPIYLTGIIASLTIIFILVRGIKLIGKITEKVVPFMFILYSGSMLWIVFMNLEKLPDVISLIFKSAFTPKSLGGAFAGIGIQQALYWGLSESVFANEAGVGTATIPHSMSASESSVNQGLLSMLSVYTNGFLCLLSGLVVLLTGSWTNSNEEFGISILLNIFNNHFAELGSVILIMSVILFASGAMLGNSYNGSQCYLYLTKGRWISLYYALIGITIFLCSIVDMKLLWSLGGFFIIPVAVPNVLGIVILAFREKDFLKSLRN